MSEFRTQLENAVSARHSRMNPFTERWVNGELRPDLTLVFDVPVEVALGRLPGDRRDRFESKNKAYFERVRAAYLKRAAAEPGRIRIVDGHQSPANVKKIVEDIISTRC